MNKYRMTKMMIANYLLEIFLSNTNKVAKSVEELNHSQKFTVVLYANLDLSPTHNGDSRATRN